MTDLETVCRTICKSDRFDTGEGTCAVYCMDQLGSPRAKGCHHVERIHGKMAQAILDALAKKSS